MRLDYNYLIKKSPPLILRRALFLFVVCRAVLSGQPHVAIAVCGCHGVTALQNNNYRLSLKYCVIFVIRCALSMP